MKKLTAILAGISAVAFASTAQAQTATINYTGPTTPVPPSPGNPAVNDFQSQLAGYGLGSYISTGLTSIVLSGPASLSFEFFGSESGYSDTFNAGGTSTATFTENTNFTNNFLSPFLIGWRDVAGGPLTGLNFTTSGVGSGGMNAAQGSAGFGVFVPNESARGSFTGNTFWLGYDDQITNTDDNHDDFIVRVRVNAPVPEPATWAMMLVGFGAVGYGMRRRTRKVALQAA